MSYFQGIACRGTAGFVTDPSGFDHELATTIDYPRTTPQGNVVGYTAVPPSFSLDRNSGNDARIAGCAVCVNSGSSDTTFEFDLPAAGAYLIGCAVGDPSYARSSQGISVYDNTTLLAQLFTGVATGSANHFVNATGTVYSAAAWPGSNSTVSLTFASTKCVFKVDTGSQYIACLYVQAVASGTSVTRDFPVPLEALGTTALAADASLPVELLASQDLPQIDIEWLGTVRADRSVPAESLASAAGAVTSDAGLPIESAATQRIDE